MTGEIQSGEGSLSDEQVGGMARSAGLLAFFSLLVLLFLFGTIMLGFVMPGGLVANERRSGAIMLWAQHPMSLTAFYLQRYLGIQVATLAAMLLFGLTIVLVDLPPENALGSGPASVLKICLEGMFACAIGFGVSALGIRRAAFFGLVYYLVSGVVGEALRAPPEAMSAAPLAVQWAVKILPFALFPVNVIERLVDGLQAGVAWDWRATGLVLYHSALWTVVAWLGLRRIDRKPLKL